MTLQVEKPKKARPRRAARMTYAQFLKADLPHHHFEWVDGRAVEMPAVEFDHAELSLFITRLLFAWVEAKDIGTVLTDPFQMKLPGKGSGRAPDVQVILNASRQRLKKLYLDGPADLVVEVVSQGTRQVDRRDKFKEYAEGGVREYGIIDPLRTQAEFYVLEQGRYIPAALDDKARFHSVVLKGLWLDIDWLWKRPPISRLLKQLGAS